MKFIRDDGKIYNPEHTDTIRRLINSNRFMKLSDVTVEQLKDYARDRDMTGYSGLKRDELVALLEEGD